MSQRKRKRVEEVFGWMKTIALQRKTRFRGPDRVGWMFTFAAAAYNLIQDAKPDGPACLKTKQRAPSAPDQAITASPDQTYPAQLKSK